MAHFQTTCLSEAVKEETDTLHDCLELLRRDHLGCAANADSARWFCKDDDDEYEIADNALELERMHRSDPLLGASGQYLRVDSNEQLERSLLRVPRCRSVPNIGAALDEKHRSPQRLHCELQRDILFEAHCGGDAVAIHIDSVVSSICYDTLFAAGQAHDMPMAAIVIEKTSDDVDATDYREHVDSWLDACRRRSCFDVIPLHHQCSIKVSSSMLSYLLQPDRVSLVVYDSDFRLLAVGVHRGEYVPFFESVDSNPYRYDSLLRFHHTLGVLYRLALRNEGLRVKNMVSAFNRSVRSCLRCSKDAMLWSSAIDSRQTLKQLMRIKPCIGGGFEDGDDDRGDTLEKDDEASCVPACVSAEKEEHAQADLEQGVECAICYERIEEGDVPLFHGHNDLCAQCVAEWTTLRDDCPKCGAVVSM